MNKLFYTAQDVKQMLGVSETKSYAIIKQLNAELEGKGFLVVRGKVNRQYFNEKIYGAEVSE